MITTGMRSKETFKRVESAKALLFVHKVHQLEKDDPEKGKELD